MGGKAQKQAPNQYQPSYKGGFDPRGPGVPSSGSPITFGGTPNRSGLIGGVNIPTGMAAPPSGGQYNLDPRQAAQFAALPAATQEQYYQGGMNRPTGMAAPPSLPPTMRDKVPLAPPGVMSGGLAPVMPGGPAPVMMGSQQLAAGLGRY